MTAHSDMAAEPSLSLDIGTRKVAGLVTVPHRGGLRILAAERMEHRTRAMYDGQVHDVVEVARVVAAIKAKLEARVGRRFTEAAVAAAGRALRTFRGVARHTRSPREPITPEEDLALELAAVQEAQRALARTVGAHQEARDYLYVGHSVLERRLDGLPLTNLVGQRGEEAEVEVIATFLPRGVVDSLLAVLERVGLELSALTLEPIAAIGVVIPPSMRHLNLVLVDIGAGTSDIAITRRGTVVAYDMVPIAGDEITEALSEAYLLDFNVAEQVKRQLTGRQTVTFQDILGRTHQVATDEVKARLAPAVERLAQAVAERILALNGAPPQAVVLVGGGSQTPGLTEALAAALGLPPDRVAVRGRDAVAGVTGARSVLGSPDAVTPIGIAVAAREHAALGFAYVHVNGVGVRLYHPTRLTVADALLAAGFEMKDLQPRLGPGLTVRVNGELRLVPGTPGRPAAIRVNGEPATLQSPIRHRDQVEVVPAVPGQPGQARVRDLAPAMEPLRVVVEDREVEVPPLVRVNGLPRDLESPVQDNDEVEIRPRRTLAEALEVLPLPDLSEQVVLRYRLNGDSREWVYPRYRVLVDGVPADPSTPLRPGCRIQVRPADGPTVGDAAAPALAAAGPPVRVRVGDRVIPLRPPPRIRRGGVPVDPREPLRNLDDLTVEVDPESPPIFADLLARIGLDPTPPPGKSRLRMEVNGRPADFVTPLQDGDEVAVTWE